MWFAVYGMSKTGSLFLCRTKNDFVKAYTFCSRIPQGSVSERFFNHNLWWNPWKSVMEPQGFMKPMLRNPALEGNVVKKKKNKSYHHSSFCLKEKFPIWLALSFFSNQLAYYLFLWTVLLKKKYCGLKIINQTVNSVNPFTSGVAYSNK